MKKTLIISTLFFLASSCNAATSKVDGLILNKNISDIDTSGFTLIEDDNSLASGPKRMDERLIRYFYMSSDVAGKKPSDIPHNKKYTMAMFYTLDGKIISTVIFTDIDKMQEAQHLLQDKYGLPIATKTGVRDQKAFESSMAYCENDPQSLEGSKIPCPSDYYEIYEGKDQVFSVIEGRSPPDHSRKERLVVAGITKEGKDYLNR